MGYHSPMTINDTLTYVIDVLTDLRRKHAGGDSIEFVDKQRIGSAVPSEPLIIDGDTWLDDCGFPLVGVSTGR